MKAYQKAVDDILPKLETFFTRGFDVHVSGAVKEVQSLSNEMVMVVSTHRSQTDYFLFGWSLYNHGIKHVRIAAGDNLTTFPVLGKKFRSFGAFAIHRDSGFKRNYVRDLCKAVVDMMEDGEPILLFPEGGRSYSGAMMEIKGGVLSAAVIAQAKHPDKKVVLVPASVSYEFLPELPYFGMLAKGKEMRKKENGFFKRLLGNAFYFGADIIAFAKLLVKVKIGCNHGDVFIDLGQPVCVTDMVDIKANFNSAARDEFSGHQASVRIVSDTIFKMFVSLYRLLPEHLVAAALGGRGSATKPEIIAEIGRLRGRCKQQNRNCQSIDMFTDDQICAVGLKQLLHVKAVAVRGDAVVVTDALIVSYYASTIS